MVRLHCRHSESTNCWHVFRLPLPVHTIYAEYVHFVDLNAPLNDDEHAQLERLLKYGPALASHAPQGKLLLVTPRPHHLSRLRKRPIRYNCGLQQVNRLERGVAYYIEAGTLTNEQWQQVTAELRRPHDGNGLLL